MNFRQFIYYCAVCGGSAAFVAFGIVWLLGLAPILDKVRPIVGVPLIGGILGLLVAGSVGAMDALLNSAGNQRLVRVLICMGIGMVGGLFGALFGQLLVGLSHWLLVLGWMLTGAMIGASIGAFDLYRASQAGEATSMALKKVINGVIGGVGGGLLGGLLFAVISHGMGSLARSSLAIGLVVLGALIGLMIGLAQVFLKEAWIKIEAGFRTGREVMLGKEVTTIGRSESCDIGLFRDNTIEKTHALISLKDNRYVLSDVDTPAGTYLNDRKISRPEELKNGDLIRVGSSYLRFGERQKRT